MSPYMLKEKKVPLFPIDIELKQQDITLSASQLINNRNYNFDNYKKAIEKGKIEIKKRLKKGDNVLIFKDVLSGKFKNNWESGYIIEEIVDPDAYVVKKGNKFYRLNKSRVKFDSSK
ncbi:MAG: hypothetical protein ACRC28_09375 [Clostridium sp.]|uniref:hypothetical protein n=1 Tax=Clostridium sp. TaxID=1506 RepID=UPI003F3C1E65